MPTFKYTAYDQHGTKFDGQIDASSSRDALAELKKHGYLVSGLSETFTLEGVGFGSLKQSVSLQQLEFFTSELSILLKNGVKIDRGLSIIEQNTATPALKSLVGHLLTAVRRGDVLSQAMAEKHDVFTPLYINLVKLGESTGNLSMVFERLSLDLKFQRELKDKISQALTYPSIILFVCILCILFVFNYIVPQMSGLFSGVDELPGYTEVLLGVSQWFQNYQWYLFGAIGIAIVALQSVKKTPSWQSWSSRVLLKLPLVKNFVLLAEQIRFNSALMMMLDAGLAIDKAMKLATDSLKLDSLKQQMQVAQQKIRKGSQLSQVLRHSPLYPQFSISLLEVGEESGDLVPVFEELSRRAKLQFESAINKFTSVLEPLLILFMGGIVGSVVVTMLLSIVSVNDLGM